MVLLGRLQEMLIVSSLTNDQADVERNEHAVRGIMGIISIVEIKINSVMRMIVCKVCIHCLLNLNFTSNYWLYWGIIDFHIMRCRFSVRPQCMVMFQTLKFPGGGSRIKRTGCSTEILKRTPKGLVTRRAGYLTSRLPKKAGYSSTHTFPPFYPSCFQGSSVGLPG